NIRKGWGWHPMVTTPPRAVLSVCQCVYYDENFEKDRQMTRGECLRAAMDAALAREAQESDRQLEWDERDTHHLDAAVRCTDRVDILQRQLDVELSGENRASVVVKISAELRALDRAV